MSLKFYSLSSGSSGNSYLITTEDSSILIDAGTTGKTILSGVKEYTPLEDKIDGIFITHEHHDHIKNLAMIHRKLGLPTIYSSPGGIEILREKQSGLPLEAFDVIEPGGEIGIGGLTIKAFSLSHDAQDPIGFSIEHQGKSIAIVTDTGVVTEEIFQAMRDAELIVLEANHERNMLLMGRYPFELKQRILGEEGHLSNEDAAEAILRILRERENPAVPTIALAHLSQQNNLPDIAVMTIKNILEENKFYRDKDYYLQVLERDIHSGEFEL